jgi:hypothetical protein
MGFPDRLLTEYEPGHRDPEPDEPALPALGPRSLTRLMHAMRGAKRVRASFELDTSTGAVSERAL